MVQLNNLTEKKHLQSFGGFQYKISLRYFLFFWKWISHLTINLWAFMSDAICHKIIHIFAYSISYTQTHEQIIVYFSFKIFDAGQLRTLLSQSIWCGKWKMHSKECIMWTFFDRAISIKSFYYLKINRSNLCATGFVTHWMSLPNAINHKLSCTRIPVEIFDLELIDAYSLFHYAHTIHSNVMPQPKHDQFDRHSQLNRLPWIDDGFFSVVYKMFALNNLETIILAVQLESSFILVFLEV